MSEPVLSSLPLIMVCGCLPTLGIGLICYLSSGSSHWHSDRSAQPKSTSSWRFGEPAVERRLRAWINSIHRIPKWSAPLRRSARPDRRTYPQTFASEAKIVPQLFQTTRPVPKPQTRSPSDSASRHASWPLRADCAADSHCWNGLKKAGAAHHTSGTITIRSLSRHATRLLTGGVTGEGRPQLRPDLVLESSDIGSADVDQVPTRFAMAPVDGDQQLDAVAAAFRSADAQDRQPVVDARRDFSADD